ncbi:hypothetical protein ERX46_13370 [Brumimicrobium glaciale]|uniref:Uncharacterized protein n=1 Tax=Brumimicrobium glaciale TaxID=200475 RepID=A0A4Q4KIN6_9FLAO|nr:hypothetical protein [Brumimicrobium glaciale]RYM33035.1 hypothetical protein ERX46_13370 [Brumimicrobium glaciale]
MNKFSIVFLLVIGIVITSSCGNVVNTPVKTINDQKESLHKTIENHTKDKHILDSYQSLSFGQMKVFKPDAFIRLDSVYSVKEAYLRNNDYRGLRRSGIEDLIPGYRAEALQEIHEVQYEIEHIYQTVTTADSIKIHSAFYLFNYKDSLLLVTPFYNFNIDKKFKDLYYAYQFDYHFVTNRELYISEAEWDFLHFFKNKQIELIGSDELAPFMNHTMSIMEAAKKASTVDFRNVSKILAMNYLNSLQTKIAVEKFGKLMALEENKTLIGYEFKVEWIDETFGALRKSTTFSFSPYLEIESINTEVL